MSAGLLNATAAASTHATPMEAMSGSDLARGRERIVARRELFDLLSDGGRVTVVSAPAGSGKTSLVRSWIADASLTERTAWVSVEREDRDPEAFWRSVLASLRTTGVGSELVRELSPVPDLNGWTIVEQLLEDLGSLEESLLLVIDDMHELGASEAVQQLELLLLSAPVALRFVLLTRRDLRLGLHRLRLQGGVTEIRRVDLRFTLEESRGLLEASGVQLSDASLESLVRTTEGWAAGLRLAALSLARHPDPERFAVNFSGRERTVAEYLLAEVLENQPKEVSRLLLRTSVLERVSAPLADRVTGGSGSERILSDLEGAGAFVVAVDPERSWFRYHQLFADLLALELRRTAPDELPAIHLAAAEWFAEHGYPVEAIRHAQAAEDWGLAGRLLADHWLRLDLDGRRATASELLSRLPTSMVAADPELAVIAALATRGKGSVHEVERYLTLATHESASVPEHRQGRFQLAQAMVRLWLAGAHNNVEDITDILQALLAPAATREAIELGLGEDLPAVALIDLGIAEIWTGRLEQAERHLEHALAEARRIGRPLLELAALSHWALVGGLRVHKRGEKRAREAVELAGRHGWAQYKHVAGAYLTLGYVSLWRGRLEEAETWLEQAEQALHPDGEPAAALMTYTARANLEFARGSYEEAMSALQAAERREPLLTSPSLVTTRARAYRLKMLAELGETDLVQRALTEMDKELLETPEMRTVLAALRLAQDDPEAATAALAPIVDSSAPIQDPRWAIHAHVLHARASDALRDPGATSRALERSLELAERDDLLLAFLLAPTAELLKRHAQLHTTHASLISQILALQSGRKPSPRPEDAEPLLEPLSESELRVLRYLPTSMHGPEIAAELFVSVNTIRTHMRHLYAKLGVHRRADAVERARELGLLAAYVRNH
jgi:LuxR family maltose regulon positive regulatory protein